MKGLDRPNHRKKSLREEVREALLAMARDANAPATARASALRSLALMLANEPTAEAQREASGLTVEELDEEIARLNANPQQQR